METCQRCGRPLGQRSVRRYETDEIGVPVVLHDAVKEFRCSACKGDTTIEIPDLGGLIATVARALAARPYKLSGREIRFLRRAAELKATELARMLGVRKETVSRWENAREPINDSNEKLLRIVIATRLEGRAPVAIDYGNIATMAIKPAQPSPAKRPVHLRYMTARTRRREKEWWNLEGDEKARAA